MAVPVIASTITTLCAFAPLLLWPGIIGDFMSYLPVTLIIGLTASLVVALVFNPTLCAYLMKPPAEGSRKLEERRSGPSQLPADPCLGSGVGGRSGYEGLVLDEIGRFSSSLCCHSQEV